MNQNQCIICGAQCLRALNIMGHRVCPRCEGRIMTLNASDAQYDDFLRRLKDVSREVTMEKR